MKILFLIRSLDPGGAERQLVNLANGLAARGHEVGLAVFYAGGVLEDQLRGVRLLDLGKRGRWDVVGFLARVFGLLRAQRPDVVHGYLGTANVLCGLVKPFFPGLRAVFGLRASNMDLSRYDRLVRLSFALERRLSRLADRIVVNSASGLEHAAGLGFPRARMAVVKNGIDSALFRPDPEGRARVRREWGVGEAELLIGSAARLDPMKDHPTFLKAAARVRASGLAARFVCIGSGPPDAAQGLRALADSLGLGQALIWAGLRRDMPAALSALDLACSSSLFGEGFPNAVAEAMACGVPCVVTDVGDSAEIVGDPGLVAPPGDPEALARALLAAAAAPPPARGLRERIVAEFSVDKMVEATQALLLDLV